MLRQQVGNQFILGGSGAANVGVYAGGSEAGLNLVEDAKQILIEKLRRNLMMSLPLVAGGPYTGS